MAFLAGRPFAEAIGRQRWELFQDALVGDGGIDAARACLAGDPAAADELREAARWWAEYRDTDVGDRLRELLG